MLHGQTRDVTVAVTMAQGHYLATVKLRQTDFGITPISIAGGAVSVKDEVQIDADIVTARPASSTPTATSSSIVNLPGSQGVNGPLREFRPLLWLQT